MNIVNGIILVYYALFWNFKVPVKTRFSANLENKYWPKDYMTAPNESWSETLRYPQFLDPLTQRDLNANEERSPYGFKALNSLSPSHEESEYQL